MPTCSGPPAGKRDPLRQAWPRASCPEACSARACDASQAAADCTMAWVPELDTNLPLSVSRKLHWLCGAGDRAVAAPLPIKPVLLNEEERQCAPVTNQLTSRQAMHSTPSSRPKPAALPHHFQRAHTSRSTSSMHSQRPACQSARAGGLLYPIEDPSLTPASPCALCTDLAKSGRPAVDGAPLAACAARPYAPAPPRHGVILGGSDASSSTCARWCAARCVARPQLRVRASRGRAPVGMYA